MDPALKHIIIIVIVIIGVIVAAAILSRVLLLMLILSILETVLGALTDTENEASWWDSIQEGLMKLISGQDLGG